MRVELLNKNGGKMFVDDSRVNEYLAAGHKLVAKDTIKEETNKEPVIKEEPKKKARKVK